ncbi:MAG TPA: hypothetical protein VHU44_18880 [Acidobacteriaceae bacterium]|jgi:hypothetical protein|nr:hypothetical protein [Acidobacteriaceae bacterium]
MSFPRSTDVAKHLARKPKPTIKLRAELVSVTDVASSDLQLLSENLSAAVRGAANRAEPGGGQ